MIARTLFSWKVAPAARRPKFWIHVALFSAVMGVGLAYVTGHYRIGCSNEAEQSVGSMWAVIRLQGGPVPVGSYGVFTTDARVKTFPPGSWFVKRVVGAPGDLVHVGTTETTVNGVRVAGPLDSADALGLSVASLERTYILGPTEYFAVGTRPHSYDSRYWGPVDVAQFVGKATLL